MKEVKRILEAAGVVTSVATATTELDLIAEFKTLLPNSANLAGVEARRAARDSPLLMLWAGHGDTLSEGGVRLVAADTDPHELALITPKSIVDIAVRTGARQVLVIIDACYAGQDTIPALAVADRWQIAQLDQDGERPWIAVLSSAGAGERARDGAFGAHLVRILRDGPTTEKLRPHWDPHNAWIDGDMLLKALEQEWPATADHRVTPVIKGTSADQFLPNPLYSPRSPARVVEHLLRAARGGDLDDETWYFTGRQTPVARVVGWVRARVAGIRVVTGPPGSGKSAVLGFVTCLSDPVLRKALVAQRDLHYDDPGANSVHAHVHVSGLRLREVVRQIDDQLTRAGVIPQSVTDDRDAAGLLQAVGNSRRCPVVFLDGLDEAGSEAWIIAQDLLKALSAVATVVISTRDLPAVDNNGSLVEQLQPDTTHVLRILDVVDDEADLREYVVRRLAQRESTGMDPALIADAIVERIVRAAESETSGRFLFARIVTSQLRTNPLRTDAGNWQRSLATSVRSALDSDLAQLRALVKDGEEIPSAATMLLTALTWALGKGLPDDIWPIVASAIVDGITFSREDVYWALSIAGRYVVADGESGRAAYRPAHKELSDHLIERFGDSVERATGRVATALTAHYRTILADGAQPADHIYLRRHLWQYCAEAGDTGLAAMRELARERPVFDHDLALTLEYQGRKAADLGLHQRAAQLSLEAVTHRRALAAADPAFVPYLAGALFNLGLRSAEVSDRNEAIESTEEAVELFRILASANSAYVPDLASALSNLGVSYGIVGRVHDALAVTEKSVATYRAQTEKNPAFLPDLAHVLSNLGIRYREAGRPLDAIKPVEEAIALHRTLAAENPAFLPRLASALNDLGVSYSAVGRTSEAIAVTEEAVALRRTQAEENPLYMPDFAGALNNLGVRYSEARRHNDAIYPAEAAVNIWRDLAAEQANHLPELAAALDNLGICFSEIGQHDRAVAATEEAVEIGRVQAAKSPAFVYKLAGMLSNLGNRYSKAPLRGDALAPTEEAARILRTLAAGNAAYLPTLAGVLTNLSRRYSEAGRPGDAVARAEEAVTMRRVQAASNPAHLPGLASALNDLAIRYSEVDQWNDAIAFTEEAVGAYRDLVEHERAYLPDFIWALNNLFIRYLEAGMLSQASRVIATMVELQQQTHGPSASDA